LVFFSGISALPGILQLTDGICDAESGIADREKFIARQGRTGHHGRRPSATANAMELVFARRRRHTRRFFRRIRSPLSESRMKSNGLSLHHPFAFWTGTAAIIAGVLAHIPMFVCASHMGYRMVGMEMDAMMLTGMALIPIGLLLAAYGVMPRMARLRAGTGARGGLHFHIADGIPLNRQHWYLVAVLVVALTIDVM
jgi:hypothetical protein